jgi:hypothetical protein
LLLLLLLLRHCLLGLPLSPFEAADLLLLLH